MAKTVDPTPKNRRGAPEAVQKRRAARAFNDLLTDGGKALDGRTARRRSRLLEELTSGKKRTSGRELKPVEVLAHVNELLDLGEAFANIKKVCAIRKSATPTSRLIEVVSDLHSAYGFRPETYRFVGVEDAVLRRAGILKPKTPRRTARVLRRGN